MTFVGRIRLSWHSELPDHSYEIPTNAKRFDYSSRSFGDMYTLSAGLAYLEKVGVDAASVSRSLTSWPES